MRRVNILAAAAALLALMPAVHGHPDLLAQIEALDARLQDHPHDASLLMKRGDLELRHGDFEAAQRDFFAARALNPELADLDFYQARLELQSGQPDAALASLNRYLAGNPERAGALALRAEARLALGQTVEAARDYGLAISYSENPAPGLYREQALALAGSGQDHWPMAQAVIADGLSRWAVEVSLLGLGTDIALAQDQTGIAYAYIDSLPEAIQNLPQWQARKELAQALATADPHNRSGQLRQAREVLARQISH